MPKARKAPATRSARRTAARRKAAPQKAGARWSAQVTTRSDALDLEPGVFTQTSPKLIASSLKRSAERSRRRKTSPYRSALSMLVFYINRAGSKLTAAHRQTLDQAKVELRRLFSKN